MRYILNRFLRKAAITFDIKKKNYGTHGFSRRFDRAQRAFPWLSLIMLIKNTKFFAAKKVVLAETRKLMPIILILFLSSPFFASEETIVSQKTVDQEKSQTVITAESNVQTKKRISNFKKLAVTGAVFNFCGFCVTSFYNIATLYQDPLDTYSIWIVSGIVETTGSLVASFSYYKVLEAIVPLSFDINYKREMNISWGLFATGTSLRLVGLMLHVFTWQTNLSGIVLGICCNSIGGTILFINTIRNLIMVCRNNKIIKQKKVSLIPLIAPKNIGLSLSYKF